MAAKSPPLPTATFHILLALVDGERHGYAVMREIEARTGGALRLSAGTLYRSIQRMLEHDLITEMRDKDAAQQGDERRRYYRITALGLRTAEAETARMSELVKMARARGLAPRRA